MVDCPSVFRCTSTPQNAHQIIARETHVWPSITGHSVTTANDKAHSEVLEAAKTGPVTLEVASCARLRRLLELDGTMAVDGARFVERRPCCRV